MTMNGKRVLVTHSDRFMGPALVQGFQTAGDEVIADDTSLETLNDALLLRQKVGEVDVILANLALPRPDRFAHELLEADVAPLFEAMVYPLMHLGVAFLPSMYQRGNGKLLVMGSAAALRPFAKSASYAAARAAQLAWMKAASVESAAKGVQINAIAQNFVENPDYFSPVYQATPEFAERIKTVPAGRLGTGEEAVNLARFICSGTCDFLNGATVPFTGGWAH